jgi:hypothetical protein
MLLLSLDECGHPGVYAYHTLKSCSAAAGVLKASRACRLRPRSADVKHGSNDTETDENQYRNENFQQQIGCCRLQVPLGVALAELSPAGVRALVAAAALLSAPEGLGAAVLLRRGMLAGALALLAPAHLHAVVREQPGGKRPRIACNVLCRSASSPSVVSRRSCQQYRANFLLTLAQLAARADDHP